MAAMPNIASQTEKEQVKPSSYVTETPNNYKFNIPSSSWSLALCINEDKQKTLKHASQAIQVNKKDQVRPDHLYTIQGSISVASPYFKKA